MRSVFGTASRLHVELFVGLVFGAALTSGAHAASACVDAQILSAEFKKTESGLEFRILRDSSGDSLPAQHNSQRFTVLAAGCLLDGTLFWSTSEPFTVSLDEVIAGWREGLALMSPGDVFAFRIPPNLAYGEKGYPPSIPPQAILFFRIELIDIAVETTAGSTTKNLSSDK